MRAIGYLSSVGEQRSRTSTDAQPADAAPSLAVQNANFLKYCDEQGFEPVATYLDARVPPGRVRHGLAQLLRHLNEEVRGFTIVVAQSFARLGADPTQATRTALQLRARGVQLISLEEGQIDETTMVDLWQTQANADVGAHHRRERLLERARLGLAIGRPPYGYRVGDEGRYAIDDDEAHVVRDIFRLYLQEELGIRRIAQRLNEAGCQTRRGRDWSMVSIRDLLRNPVYTGRYDKLGVSVSGNHDALVSEADFLAVAEQMARRRTATGVSHPSDFLLAGLVWCGEDHARMIGVTRRQHWRKADGSSGTTVYRYYQSEARTNRSVGDYHTRRADELEAEVLAHIRGERGGGEATILNIEGDELALAAETAVAIANAETRLRSIDRQLSQLLEDAAAGDHGPAGLYDAGASIVAAWESAQADLAHLRSRSLAHERDHERRRRRNQRLRQVREDWNTLTFPQRRELIEQLVERVIVFDHTVTTLLQA